MVLRTFFAIDNSGLIVTSSPNSSLVGGPIINASDTPDGTVFQFNGTPLTEVTLDDTGGGRNRFNDDRADDHIIVDGGGLVATGTEVESESEYTLQQLDASGNPTGPLINIYVLSQNGSFSDIWGIGLTAPLEAGAQYVKVAGDVDGTSRYRDYITCFAKGTQIKTAHGLCPVEEIKLGQMVWTKHAGLQPVRWVGTAVVCGTGSMAPVMIEAGALGNSRDLVVSQQHRIWIESAAAELYFGQSEVLVAAKHLCGLPGISSMPVAHIEYTHFMFDKHQIVRSNGILTESFFLAETALKALEEGPQAELRAMFPKTFGGLASFGETATTTLTAKEAAALKPYLVA